MGTKISGVVVGGNKIGRRLGFPTANILVNNELEALNGVYSAYVDIEEKRHYAVANLGYKPSVASDGNRVLEVHIFDFDQTIYGLVVEVELLDYIREERTFNSFEALKAQIDSDKTVVENKFKNR